MSFDVLYQHILHTDYTVGYTHTHAELIYHDVSKLRDNTKLKNELFCVGTYV